MVQSALRHECYCVTLIDYLVLHQLFASLNLGLDLYQSSGGEINLDLGCRTMKFFPYSLNTTSGAKEDACIRPLVAFLRSLLWKVLVNKLSLYMYFVFFYEIIPLYYSVISIFSSLSWMFVWFFIVDILVSF